MNGRRETRKIIAFHLCMCAFALASCWQSTQARAESRAAVGSEQVVPHTVGGDGVLERAEAHLPWRGAVPTREPYEEDPADEPLRNALTAALVVVVVISLVSFACFSKLSPRHVQSLNLLQLLICMFMIFMLQLPSAQHMPILGGALFAGLVGLFKLMSRFEAPASVDNEK